VRFIHYYNYNPLSSRCYGSGQSLRGWQRNRLALSFETTASAKERNQKVKQKSRARGIVTWDTEALKEEVKSYDSERVVNWSELARKYDVKKAHGEHAKKGGQIIKDWLNSEGVDVNRFRRKHGQSDATMTNIRRKRRKGAGGEVTVPTDVTPEKLKEILTKKIESGEYTVGQRIVPKTVPITTIIIHY
jgi:ribosomal protein S25